jgi:hypothetical protein
MSESNGKMVPHRWFSGLRVAALAHNTFLELVRMRVFYFLLLFALLVIGSSLFTVQFSFQDQFQVLKDVSLGAISIFSWLLGLLCTALLLPRDVEDRTLYTILAKPVSRFEYLLGKMLGVIGLLGVAMGVMGALFLAVLAIREQQVLAEIAREAARQATSPEDLAKQIADVRAAAFQWNLLPGLAVIYVKAVLCAMFTLLISTFATSTLFTVLVSVVVYLIGHVQGLAREYWLRGGDASWVLKGALALVALVFPDLQLFNVVDEIAVGTPVPLALFGQIAGFGVLYTLIYGLLAQVVFSSKEL